MPKRIFGHCTPSLKRYCSLGIVLQVSPKNLYIKTYHKIYKNIEKNGYVRVQV